MVKCVGHIWLGHAIMDLDVGLVMVSGQLCPAIPQNANLNLAAGLTNTYSMSLANLTQGHVRLRSEHTQHSPYHHHSRQPHHCWLMAAVDYVPTMCRNISDKGMLVH